MAATTLHGCGIPGATEPVRIGTDIELPLSADANVNYPALKARSYFLVSGLKIPHHGTRSTEHSVRKTVVVSGFGGEFCRMYPACVWAIKYLERSPKFFSPGGA